MTTDWRAKVAWAVRQIQDCSGDEPVTGLQESDITNFQSETQIDLPASYTAFMTAVGQECGDFMSGSRLAWRDLQDIQAEGRELIDDLHGIPMPGDGFVFLTHGGYQFLCFRLGGGDDPEVFHFDERSPSEFKLVAPSFSDWLEKAVRDEFPECAPRTE